MFDSQLQLLCDRKRKQEYFWIILWRSLELSPHFWILGKTLIMTDARITASHITPWYNDQPINFLRYLYKTSGLISIYKQQLMLSW